MRLCTVCGVLTSRNGSRCTEHARQSNRSRHNALYTTRAWQRLSARVLRAWRGEHGNWCPGYQRDRHGASDLTVDHVLPLAAGGAPFDIGNCAVLCRSCNSTKGSSEADRGYPHADPAAPEDRVARLQDLFRDRSVGLLIVHHARKESTDDFLTSVSGTYGITGSADTIVVIRRKRNEAFGTLYVTGRDVPDEQITARFDDLTWTAAPGALSAASFERGEVYRVVEARGPVFAKSVADELGMERTSVQHIVAGLVEQGAVARVRGGYVVAEVVIETEEPLSLPLHSTHSKSEERGGGHPPAGAPAREADLFVACDAYRDHQSEHFHTPAGWRCQICTPLEEGTTA